MSELELQKEELEVLKSIYDGDDKFKIINETTFQCKVGDDDTNHKCFLLEIHWPSNYPDESPEINLDLFFNKHISKDLKESICQQLHSEAELNAGCAVTYTLFEWAKENCENLLSNLTDEPVQVADVTSSLENVQLQDKLNCDKTVKKEKKVQLSKAQKRKQFDRLDAKGELPRGWDWVDVVKHLSQSGSSGSGQSKLTDGAS
ncbi:RWD domain containing [Chamberlinius hualienensis]